MALARLYNRSKEAIQGLLVGEDLRARATRGVALSGSGSLAEQASRFARNMLLTRLLAPSAFGAMAIVMSSAAIVGSLTDVGLKAAVVQNPRGAEKEYLNAGWWLGMAQAAFTYSIIFAMAPFVAHFYGSADLTALLRVTLLGALLNGAMSPRSILPQKELKLGRWATINNGGAICGVILTVILSFVLRDVWALAIGYCSESAFRCLMSYILCPGLPSFAWTRGAFRDLWGFSKQTFGLSFLNLIFSRSDIFVLGKLFPATALGLYTMGIGLVMTPTSFLTRMMSNTLFPAFAHVQDDKDRINRILIEVTSWIVLLGLPGVVVLYICGRSLLAVIYGPRYAVAAGPLAVAAIVVFLVVLNAAITCVFSAVGRPALHRRAVAASAVAMMILVYPICKWFGLIGGQVAALIAILLSYVIQIMRVRALTGLDLLRYGKAFVPAVIASAGILLAAYGAHSLGLSSTPITNIAVGFGACFLAYALFLPSLIRV